MGCNERNKREVYISKCIKKKEESLINKLTLHVKKVENKEQNPKLVEVNNN